MGIIETIAISGFGIALAVFVITRLNSGLSRAERKNLTSTAAE